MKRDCPTCNGTGQGPTQDRACWTCRGRGWTQDDDPNADDRPADDDQPNPTTREARTI